MKHTLFIVALLSIINPLFADSASERSAESSSKKRTVRCKPRHRRSPKKFVTPVVQKGEHSCCGCCIASCLVGLYCVHMAAGKAIDCLGRIVGAVDKVAEPGRTGLRGPRMGYMEE